MTAVYVSLAAFVPEVKDQINGEKAVSGISKVLTVLVMENDFVFVASHISLQDFFVTSIAAAEHKELVIYCDQNAVKTTCHSEVRSQVENHNLSTEPLIHVITPDKEAKVVLVLAVLSTDDAVETKVSGETNEADDALRSKVLSNGKLTYATVDVCTLKVSKEPFGTSSNFIFDELDYFVHVLVLGRLVVSPATSLLIAVLAVSVFVGDKKVS